MLNSYETYEAVQAAEHFLAAFDRMVPEQAVLCLHSVWAREPGGPWIHVYTYGRVTLDGLADGLEVTEAQYPFVKEVRWKLPREGVRSFIVESVGSGLIVPGTPSAVTFAPQVAVEYRERLQHNPPRLEPWPVVMLAFTPPERKSFPRAFHSPVTKRDADAYTDGTDFLRARTQHWRWSTQYDWYRGMCIEFEDMRGRVQRVGASDWLAGEVFVDIESGTDCVAEVRYVVDGDWAPRRGSFERLVANGSRWHTVLPPGSVALSVLAIDTEGELLDRQLALSVERLMTELPTQTSAAEMRRLVDLGESDRAEMKSWLLLREDRKAKEAVLRTVNALANTRGGDLLIGVSNSLHADGPMVQFTPSGAVILDAVIRRAVESVREWITEECEPSVSHALEVAQLDGRAILRVHIGEAEFKPCLIRSGAIYVREGARSRPPTRVELLQLCRTGA
jgi:hypothetical protein